MGAVSAASIIFEDGSTAAIQDLEQINTLGDRGRVELAYDYGPDLLPSPGYSCDGMWRYSALLPLQYRHLYPLPVGGTPLIASASLRQWTGLPGLWVKDETRSPTGSNKDRATALVLEYALQQGIQTISCASTGNVAVSLAVGAAAAEKDAVIFVPASVADAKLRLMLLAGAQVFKVEAGYEAAVKLSRLATHTFGWYDRNTGYNPFTLEAKKTVALEIWEQLNRQVPDVILCQVGDGVTLSGLAKGFRELIKCGATRKLPRLVGVQAEGCAPLKRAWERQEQVQATATDTLADGIAVSAPINAAMTLRDVRESQGSFITVSDTVILQAMNTLMNKGGICAEPAGAASFAGLQFALEAGLIHPTEVIVILITGTGLKNLHTMQPITSGAVYQVHSSIEEVWQALKH